MWSAWKNDWNEFLPPCLGSSAFFLWSTSTGAKTPDRLSLWSDVLETPLLQQAANFFNFFFVLFFFSGFVVQLTIKQGQVLCRYWRRASSFSEDGWFLLFPVAPRCFCFVLSLEEHLKYNIVLSKDKTLWVFFFSSLFSKPFHKKNKTNFNNIKIP